MACKVTGSRPGIIRLTGSSEPPCLRSLLGRRLGGRTQRRLKPPTPRRPPASFAPAPLPGLPAGRKLLQDPDGALSNEQCCAAIQEGRLINCICSASPGGDTGTAQTDGTTKGQGTAAANNGGSTGAGGGAEAAPIGQGVRCPDAEVVLELHNRPRLSRGAQPLQWSESLAADAAAWSAQCNRDSFGYSVGLLLLP